MNLTTKRHVSSSNTSWSSGLFERYLRCGIWGRVRKTNNDLESWRNRLNTDVGKCKNVFFIIQTLINDNVDSSVLEQQLEKGLLPSTDKRENAEKNETIAVLERGLEAGKKDEREFCRWKFDGQMSFLSCFGFVK